MNNSTGMKAYKSYQPAYHQNDSYYIQKISHFIDFFNWIVNELKYDLIQQN